mgnify:CR=1 FL=1
MDTLKHTIKTLFEQLGLDSSDRSIAKFIEYRWKPPPNKSYFKKYSAVKLFSVLNKKSIIIIVLWAFAEILNKNRCIGVK